MYLRTRKNKSGSTSVFVIASKRFKGRKNPRSIVVKSFGSSKDSAKIESLCQAANQFIQDTKYTPFLRISSEKDIESSQVKTIGFKHVYGHIFEKYFSDMKLGSIDYTLLKELALMRIAQPVSKLKTAEIAPEFNFEGITPNKIYKFMDTLDRTVIDRLKQSVFAHTKQLINKDKLSVLFYDLTTIYFENNHTSELKRLGFSKDGKNQHVQISLALIVSEFGLPVSYEIFPGNIYEGKTLIPVLLRMRQEYGINEVTIVADSAMLSSSNLAELTRHHFKYIVAARVKNLKSTLTKQVLNRELYRTLNEDIRYQTISLDNERLISCYSEKRAQKDAYDRELALKRLDKILGTSVKNKLRSSLKKPYIKLSQQSVLMLDEDKIEHAKKLDGYFGFYTNTNLSPEAVIDQYRGLWQVEQTFRVTKHNLAIRPVYHYKDRRIAAHFAICFLALALVRTSEYLLLIHNQKTSPESLHHLLNQVKTTQIVSKGQTFNITAELSPQILAVFSALNIPNLKLFSFQEMF